MDDENEMDVMIADGNPPEVVDEQEDGGDDSNDEDENALDNAEGNLFNAGACAQCMG